jgi:hypothetical protein
LCARNSSAACFIFISDLLLDRSAIVRLPAGGGIGGGTDRRVRALTDAAARIRRDAERSFEKGDAMEAMSATDARERAAEHAAKAEKLLKSWWLSSHVQAQAHASLAVYYTELADPCREASARPRRACQRA